MNLHPCGDRGYDEVRSHGIVVIHRSISLPIDRVGGKNSPKSCRSLCQEGGDRPTTHVKYSDQRLGTAELPEEQASEHEGLD